MLNYPNDICYIDIGTVYPDLTHMSILYDFINDNDLCVANFTDPQHIQYTYLCDSTATYTWIDHCLTTSQNIVSCNIIPRHADNVSDHLPLCLQTRVLSEQCQPAVLSTDVPQCHTQMGQPRVYQRVLRYPSQQGIVYINSSCWPW